MAQPGITLGGFVFSNRNSAGGLSGGNPEQVKFGLKEQIVIHKMVGGARILDMLGDDPEDISWNGFFLGPDAPDLANALYALEQGKELLDLTFGVYSATVVISQLDLVYKKAFWIDYSIVCVVIDQAAGGGGVGAGVGANDIGDPNVGNAGIANANTQLANVNTPNDALNGLNTGLGGLQAGTGAPFGGITFA
jgi:hypothetical protein